MFLKFFSVVVGVFNLKIIICVSIWIHKFSYRHTEKNAFLPICLFNGFSLNSLCRDKKSEMKQEKKLKIKKKIEKTLNKIWCVKNHILSIFHALIYIFCIFIYFFGLFLFKKSHNFFFCRVVSTFPFFLLIKLIYFQQFFFLYIFN